MTLLIGALTIGFILALLALGVLVSFRIFGMADITTDGSITLGASITAILLVNGANPLLATLAGTVGGMLAGTVTGIIHTRFKINPLLSGILVMTALYSVNLHVMGRSNVPLMQARTLATYGETLGVWMCGGPSFNALGWRVGSADAAVLMLALVAAAAVGCVIFAFFRTHLGTAMRATGDNAQMGIGMVVWGLASVIIGEALTGSRSLGLAIVGAIMGSVIFRLLVAIALRWGLDPNDLKLVTAIFVFCALVLPGVAAKLKRKQASAV